MKGRNVLSVFAMLVMVLALGACQGGGSSSPSGTGRVATTITAKIDSGSSKTKASGRHKTLSAAVGTAAEVTSMTVNVQGASGVIANNVPFTNNGGTWTVTVQDLPVGEQLVFTGHAFNNMSTEIFTGTASQELTGNNDEVLIAMAPVSNNTTLNFLQITKITRPAEVLASGTAPVSISVTGNAGETLTYEVISAENGGTFGPASGSIPLSGSFATIVLNYTAADITGNYIHTVRVRNGQGNSVETTFNTSIVSQLTQSDVVVQFNPVVTAVVPARNGSEVALTAYVSGTGDPAALTYAWSFSCGNWMGCGSAAIADPAANPAVLLGYDESITGTITLTVSNGMGTTTVSYAVNQAQFASTVVSNLLLLPQQAIPTNFDDCRFGAVSGNIMTLVISERDAHQDLNGDGDQADRVLHYFAVPQGAPVNTGIAVRQDSISIAGDIIAFQYPGESWEGGTIGWYSISTGESHDTGITPLAFGREYWGSTRVISNGKIAYVAATRDLNGDGVLDVELNLYDMGLAQNLPTGVMVGSPQANQRQLAPSFSGDLVAFESTTGTIAYYNVSTGVTTDTGVQGTSPTVDNGIIVFDTPSNKVWYHDTAQGKTVVTPLPVNRNYNASISNGIIATAINEDTTWGDLNGDGIIGRDDSGIIVLYDIPTGRMISTGVMLCCGPEISGFVIAYDFDSCDQWYIVLDDLVRSYFGR